MTPWLLDDMAAVRRFTGYTATMAIVATTAIVNNKVAKRIRLLALAQRYKRVMSVAYHGTSDNALLCSLQPGDQA